MEDGRLNGIDESTLLAEADGWRHRILPRGATR